MNNLNDILNGPIPWPRHCHEVRGAVKHKGEMVEINIVLPPLEMEWLDFKKCVLDKEEIPDRDKERKALFYQGLITGIKALTELPMRLDKNRHKYPTLPDEIWYEIINGATNHIIGSYMKECVETIEREMTIS